MKNGFLFMFLILSSLVSYSQVSGKIDSLFKANFLVLDSVAQGIKKQSQLSNEQNAFLYLIDGWSGKNAPFAHYQDSMFDKSYVMAWRRWYKKNSSAIDSSDYFKCINIYKKFFATGIATDSDWETIDQLNKKYKNIPHN